MNNKKILHDYQSDLASLKEGLEILDFSQDQVLREKVLKLLINKCQKISGDLAMLETELKQRMENDLRSL